MEKRGWRKGVGKGGAERGKQEEYSGETCEKKFKYLIFKIGHKDALWVDVTCPSRWRRTAPLLGPQQRMILSQMTPETLSIKIKQSTNQWAAVATGRSIDVSGLKKSLTAMGGEVKGDGVCPSTLSIQPQGKYLVSKSVDPT